MQNVIVEFDPEKDELDETETMRQHLAKFPDVLTPEHVSITQCVCDEIYPYVQELT